MSRGPYRDHCPANTRIIDLADCSNLEPICDPVDAGKPSRKLSPLTGPMNLVYFAYPRKAADLIWQRQSQLILDAWHKFDGKRMIAISFDETIADFDLSGWDRVFLIKNSVQHREVTGWRALMEAMQKEPGATVWLHAKGVGRGWAEPHLRQWTELGYQTMLDSNSVRDALKDHIFAGCFRRFENTSGWGTKWHFSGTFYAVRNEFITFPQSNAGGWCAEAWPGLITSPDMAACLRFDGCRDLYQAENWREIAS